jgi:chromosome partitioning protein
MPIVAVVNQKGGVGKTTVALGLAAAASHRGARVLVVDLDPQANATSGLGVWDPPTTVDAALAVDAPGSAARLAVTSAWPMDHGAEPGAVAPSVVASTPALAAREPQLANDPIGAQDRLQIALEGNGYDLVVIDCPPSLGLLTVNGLFAADRALVVTEPGAWASDGVAQIQRTITRIAARRDGRPAIAGIAVNRLGRTRDAKYWHGQLADDYGDAVLAPVHLRAAVAEASAQSLPIHALGARAGAAEAAAEFDALLDAVVPELARPAAPEPSSGEAPSPSPSPAPEQPSAPVLAPTGGVAAPASSPEAAPAPAAPPTISTGEPDAVVRPATIPTPPVAR